MYLDLNSWEPKGQKNTNHKIDVGYFFFGGGTGCPINLQENHFDKGVEMQGVEMVSSTVGNS